MSIIRVCFNFIFGLYTICVSILHIYFGNCCFIQNVHVQDTHLFGDFWVYTKFACPEYKFIFGILVLH